MCKIIYHLFFYFQVLLVNFLIVRCNNNNSTAKSLSKNPFNEKAFIVYRPQTSVIENNGQEKSGRCPITRPAYGFKSFQQYEGLWFKRWRSRVTTTEPFYKCAYIRYIYEGNGNIFILDNLQNNVTNEWKRQNATSVLFSTTPASWMSTLASGVKFDTHLIYFDGELGVALLYSCSNTNNGHSGIGNVYTRSPNTPLSKSYVNNLYDIYYQNGIYDVLPLHEVTHDKCETQNHSADSSVKQTDSIINNSRNKNSYEQLPKNVYND